MKEADGLPSVERRCCQLREWVGPESNRRHMDFQSIALPAELPTRRLRSILRRSRTHASPTSGARKGDTPAFSRTRGRGLGSRLRGNDEEGGGNEEKGAGLTRGSGNDRRRAREKGGCQQPCAGGAVQLRMMCPSGAAEWCRKRPSRSHEDYVPRPPVAPFTRE